MWELAKKGLNQAKDNGKEGGIKKISQNTMDTYSIMDGIGKNMRKQPSLTNPSDFGSMLNMVHIMNIKISKPGWEQFAKGLIAPSCVLKTLKVSLVEFDREMLTALGEGMKQNQSVTQLDLSYCNLKDSYGDIFGRIITE